MSDVRLADLLIRTEVIWLTRVANTGNIYEWKPRASYGGELGGHEVPDKGTEGLIVVYSRARSINICGEYRYIYIIDRRT
jgi:hypothetical protein